MKKAKLLKRAAALATVCALGFPAAALAAGTFQDVPVSHWAYQSILSVTSQNLMVGDTTGDFKPDGLIDKFETVKILARAAGYKYTGISEEELKNYNLAYEKNKSLITNYGKTFTKWNSSADRELAFLLEKEILTTEDLNQFVVKDAAGAEKLRALSREESAVFLVKLIGKKNEALTQAAPQALFKDDASITTAAKPYVYYMKGKNVIAGGTDGNFNPNAAVSRASMAVLLDKTLSVVKEETSQASVPTGVSNVNSVSGVFGKYYEQLGAVQITLQNNETKIYKLSAEATITVDGVLKTTLDLKEGMSLLAVVVNDDSLMSISAASPAGSNPTAAAAVTSSQGYYVEGIVSEVNAGDTRTIGVEVRMLNPRGEIITETRKYTVPEVAAVTRGNASAGFESIVKGDVVRVDYEGTAATAINLEEKDRTFTNVTLEEKKYVELTSTPILVLRDDAGKTYDLRVTEQTTVARNGAAGVAWSGLRIGDSLTATAEYDVLLNVSATGTRSEAEGSVSEIHLTKNGSSIVLLNASTNKNETYSLIESAMDIYALRLGGKVKLGLDSREVESVVATVATGASETATASANSLIGYILSNSGSAIMLSDTKTGGTGQEIKYNAYTVVSSAASGARLNPSTLAAGQKVTVTLTSASSGVAKTISVLAE